MKPKQVRILGKQYAIRYVTGKPLGKDEIGEHDTETQTIHVKGGMPLEREQSTVLHECIHGISDASGLELTERQVDGLETGIFALLKDNPRLVAYLRRKI